MAWGSRATATNERASASAASTGEIEAGEGTHQEAPRSQAPAASSARVALRLFADRVRHIRAAHQWAPLNTILNPSAMP